MYMDVDGCGWMWMDQPPHDHPTTIQRPSKDPPYSSIHIQPHPSIHIHPLPAAMPDEMCVPSAGRYAQRETELILHFPHPSC